VSRTGYGMRLSLGALAVLGMVACTDSDPALPVATPGSPLTIEPLRIHADADWVRDREGRVVLLRGANYSGLEFGNFVGAAHGPQASDFAQMASWGFNVIRLPIAWSYIEPAPNDFTDAYLTEQVDTVVDFAARHGILVILEMHQYLWSPCLNGNGAPAWICDGHSYANDPSGYLQASCDFFQGSFAPDGRTLMDHFVDVWRLVARHYAGDTRVGGFDFFNEPTAYSCIALGAFERTVLNPFYRRLRAAVQAEGAEQTFFYCPSITRNVGIHTIVEPMGPDVVYAPHLYTETGGAPDLQYDGDAGKVTADYTLALKEAQTLGGPLFAAEFGGNTEVAGGFRAATEAFLRDTLAEQDRRLVGGAVWAYFPSDNTFSVVDASGQEKGALVSTLVRPYGRRIAGIPTAMHFDVETREFTLSFDNDPQYDAADPTEVFVPVARVYSTGFDVQLTAGDSWQFDPVHQTILIVRGPSTTHALRIVPKGD
jgi:endoglycosylceramidase